MDERLRRIAAKLAIVPHLPGRSSSFGEERHRFRLGPPLAESEIVSFERRHGITLPAGYRAFLTILGHEGAGPYYGLLPLDRWDDVIRRTRPDRCLSRPFPFHPGRSYGRDWLDGLAAETVDEPYVGTIALASMGCTYWSLLVVSGPARGRVVNVCLDRQPPKFSPDPDFLTWYERWLDEIAAGRDMGWYGFGYRPGGDAELAGVLAGGGPVHDRLGAAAALARRQDHPPAVRAALIRALSDPAAEVREAVACALAVRPDPGAEQALTVALADLDPRVRIAALHGLEKRGSGWYETARNLAVDSVPEVQCAALRVLDESGGLPDTLLEGRITDVAAEVRSTTLWLLQSRGHLRLVGTARALLADPAPNVRMAAARVLLRNAALTDVELARLRADPVDWVCGWAERFATRRGQ
ncbi:hypothetical protein DPM19_26755 [Actinomadura craniellae]|uniref:Knr4/Smi1-like domain-containing protein n=1 Tax=Actinomadura craniellae TaxID=2231787 RepID=A0A365GYW1_9ACTN|nr:SMI1/KNR4 family protein [Actinomadura craniellae]RAY11958.1 hypothetical protein DPM19_26755 [Actinomadura craniellae]